MGFLPVVPEPRPFMLGSRRSARPLRKLREEAGSRELVVRGRLMRERVVSRGLSEMMRERKRTEMRSRFRMMLPEVT